VPTFIRIMTTPHGLAIADITMAAARAAAARAATRAAQDHLYSQALWLSGIGTTGNAATLRHILIALPAIIPVATRVIRITLIPAVTRVTPIIQILIPMITPPTAAERGRILALEVFSIRRRRFHTNTKRRHPSTNIRQRRHTSIGQRRDQAMTMSCRRDRPQVYRARIPTPATSSNDTQNGCSIIGLKSGHERSGAACLPKKLMFDPAQSSRARARPRGL
jgi:hypothetical protein